MALHSIGFSELTVEELRRAGTVGFKKGKTLTFKSSIKSPGAYINNRRLPTHPTYWHSIISRMHLYVERNLKGSFDIIAGVATGGTSHASALAWLTGQPLVIVKKEEKTKHGIGGLIDGDVTLLPSARVLLVEDMSSTFESALGAIRLLKSYGASVVHTLAIETWGFPAFYQNIVGHEVHVLCTGLQIVSVHANKGLIDQNYADLLCRWIENPRDESWMDKSWS